MEDTANNDDPNETEEADYIDKNENQLYGANGGAIDTESRVRVMREEPTIDIRVLVEYVSL